MGNSKRLKWFIISVFFLFFPRQGFCIDLDSQVKMIRLSNGMRWLVVYRPKLPVFSGLIVVRAGGVDEVKGKTGLAHMFEHMAFKGSQEIGTKNYQKEIPLLNEIAKVGREMSSEAAKEKPDAEKIEALKAQIQQLTEKEDEFLVKNEIWEVLTRHGASDLNAFTNKDITGFHASMPATQFPLWSYIYSEMIFQPVMREFYQERDVVMEERRLRYDNNPQGFIIEKTVETAFPKGPYHWSPIGEPRDLASLTMEDALVFHEKNYDPRRIVGVLVGAIPPAQAQKVLEKYFGRFKSGELSKDPEPLSFAFQGQRRFEVRMEAEPYLILSFYKPKVPAKEDYIFDVLDGILCDGRTARLYQTLVREKKMAASVYCSASFPGSRQDNLFSIFISPLNGVSLKKIEETLFEELAKLQNNLQESELEKVRKSVLFNFYFGLQDNLELAEQLAVAEALMEDWRYVATYPKKIEAITLEEVKATAAKFFKRENSVVVYRLKKD